MKFNREYAPDGWVYDRFGDPDIVFMARTNNYSESEMRANVGRPKSEWRTAKSTDYTDDWDAAKSRSIGAAEAASGSGQVGAGDQPSDSSGGGVGGTLDEDTLKSIYSNVAKGYT